CLPLVKTAKSVSAQGLHDAHVDVGVVVPQKRFAVELYPLTQRVQIMREQFLAQLRRQVRLGIEQKRGDVVLQRALPPALIVHKERIAAAQQNISRLKIAVQKIIAV